MASTANSTTDDSRRPKVVVYWDNCDVMKWLKRHGEEYYDLYGHLFVEHQITGRSLLRMTDVTLQRLGISNSEHRNSMCRMILKLKLKCDIVEMKNLENQNLRESLGP